MARCHLRHGPGWSFQWCWAGWLSLGIHIEPRHTATLGPYLDLHLGPAIVSLGRLGGINTQTGQPL